MRGLYILVSLGLILGCSSVEEPQLAIGGPEQIRADVYTLAADSLAGRDTGSPGEAMAAAYIAQRFQALGLESIIDGPSYYQTFDFTGSPLLDPNNYLQVGARALTAEEYFPLNFSGSGATRQIETVNLGFGIIAPELERDDYAGKSVSGKLALIDISIPSTPAPALAYLSYLDLRAKAASAQKAGAQAVIFYRSRPLDPAPSSTLTVEVDTLDIPVFFCSLLRTELKNLSFEFKIDRPALQGKNVLGFMDKQQEKTLVIGAHYDHLGMGGGGSLHEGEPSIHNGADDNASGVAAMLECAYLLRELDLSCNVLFIAFSGEERGLLGSYHFVKEAPIALERISYMINMDMVGRLTEANRVLQVHGVGSSPAWRALEQISDSTLRTRQIAKGNGPSDHASFYWAEIPALHLHTGTHEDYHRPSDDVEHIDFPGISQVADYALAIIAAVDQRPDMSFSETNGTVGQLMGYPASLGLVPDSDYTGPGMRIAEVAIHKAADRAGLLEGDVILELDALEIQGLYDYTDALADIRPGQIVSLKIERDEAIISLEATFE